MAARVTNDVVVYRATNLVNGKCYIGVTKCGMARRRRQHINLAINGGGYRLHAAIRKYGADKIAFEELFNFKDDIELALVYEAEVVDAEKPAYNTIPGGWVWNGALSPETLARIASGEVHSRTRRKMTDEEKASRKIKMARHPHPFKGKKHTPESVAKISLAKTGSPGPWEGKKRPHVTDKTKQAVLCETDGRGFPSIKAAEEFYGIRKDGVGRALRGGYSVNGMTFRKVEDGGQ